MESLADNPVGSSAEVRVPAPSVRPRTGASVVADGKPPMGLSVREVLAAPCLRDARVLAGEAGLDRVVSRLNVMEVPDILPWVKPYELLLTTGYPLRDDPAALVRLIADLDDRRLSAIAIKLHRYIDEIPPEVLAEASRRSFPVIEFPPDVGFDDVLNEVIGTLLDRQAALAARSEEVHRALVSVVLDGGGLDDLAAELARIFQGPVFITTPDGRVVAQAGDGEQIQLALESSLFDRSGRFRVEADPSREAGGQHHSPFRRTGPADRRGPRSRRRWHDCAVVPIVAGRVDHGRIVAFSAAPVTDADRYCLERAATVAALAVTKRLAVAAVEDRYRADFLRELLTGRVPNLAQAVHHAAGLGWDIDRPTVVAVAELDPGQVASSPSGLELRPVQERFVAAWQTVLRTRDPAAAVAGLHTEVVALLRVPADGDLVGLLAELDRQIAGDRGGGRVTFSLGLSRVAAGPAQLPRAYEQARTAVRIGRRLQGGGARATFDQLGAYRLLAQIPDNEELRGFVSDVLGELALDTPEAADLRHTLETLLDNNCNVAESARRLHYHYNTLRYRIEKLERMLGSFTTSPALRLDLTLALRVHHMVG